MQESSVREEEAVSEHENTSSTIQLESGVLRSVNKIVREAVISGFAHFGNKNVVDSLLYILELEHAVDAHSIAENIPSFRAGIAEMFGSGAYVLEEHVCDELARKLGIDRNGRNLETLVSMLKKTSHTSAR